VREGLLLHTVCIRCCFLRAKPWRDAVARLEFSVPSNRFRSEEFLVCCSDSLVEALVLSTLVERVSAKSHGEGRGLVQCGSMSQSSSEHRMSTCPHRCLVNPIIPFEEFQKELMALVQINNFLRFSRH